MYRHSRMELGLRAFRMCRLNKIYTHRPLFIQMADANTLLLIFGSSFGGVVGLAVFVGIGVEVYRRYYMPEENEFTDPQNNV